MTIEAAEQYDGDNEPQNDCADAAPSRPGPGSARQCGADRSADEEDTHKERIQAAAHRRVDEIDRPPSERLIGDDAGVERRRAGHQQPERERRVRRRREAAPAGAGCAQRGAFLRRSDAVKSIRSTFEILGRHATL